MADEGERAQGHFSDEPSPGERLRAARRKKKLDTKEIASTLNVDPWMLDALEHDEYGALGAPVFAKGHLRKYATALGLDADDLMIAYYQRAGTREAPPLIAESIMRVETSHGPRLTWIAPTLGVLILAIVALGVFLYLKPDGAAEPARAASRAPVESSTGSARSTTLRLPGANELSAPATDASPEPTRAPVSVSVTNSSPEPEPEPKPQPESATDQAAAEAASVVSPPAARATPSPPERAPVTQATALPGRDTTSAGDAQVTVTLSFRGESWVEVYDRNRTKLLYGMGDPGSTRSIVGSPPLKVFLGKAGEVTVQVDGRDFPVPRVSRLGTARFEVATP